MSKQKESSAVGRLLPGSGNSQLPQNVTFTVPNEPVAIVSLKSTASTKPTKPLTSEGLSTGKKMVLIVVFRMEMVIRNR